MKRRYIKKRPYYKKKTYRRNNQYRRRSGTVVKKKSSYDGSYRAKCTIQTTLTNQAGPNPGDAGAATIVVGWGQTPINANVTSPFGNSEFIALSTVFKEWKIQGVKITVIPAYMAVNTRMESIAGDTTAKYGAIYGINKASFQDMSNAQTNALALSDFLKRYDYKFTKTGLKQKFWIKLSRYWKQKNGQQWISAQSPAQAYAPATVNTDNYTALLIETQDIDNLQRVAQVRIDYFVKFRHIVV